MARCTRHKQTVGDDSPRGEQYIDDRTVLALVYDVERLIAMVYDAEEVETYQSEPGYDVILTEAGECEFGRCPYGPDD